MKASQRITLAAFITTCFLIASAAILRAQTQRATSECQDEELGTFTLQAISTLRAHYRMAQAALPAPIQPQ